MYVATRPENREEKNAACRTRPNSKYATAGWCDEKERETLSAGGLQPEALENTRENRTPGWPNGPPRLINAQYYMTCLKPPRPSNHTDDVTRAQKNKSILTSKSKTRNYEEYCLHKQEAEMEGLLHRRGGVTFGRKGKICPP